MTDRAAVTNALAGPLVNARATSAGVAPCAPIPGSRRIDCGRSRRAFATARRSVAPTTAPTLESPRIPPCSAALPVSGQGRARSPRVPPPRLEGAPAGSAERLEERRLRLDADGVRRH